MFGTPNNANEYTASNAAYSLIQQILKLRLEDRKQIYEEFNE